MKSNLKIYTSFVSPVTLDVFIKSNYLPIFIIRHISNSKLIGQYSGTAVHFPELSPSSSLYQDKRDERVTLDEFRKAYTIEISKVNLGSVIKKLEYMSSLCSANGVILLGYGTDNLKCHRSVLAGILNSSGILENEVKEILV